MVYFLVCRARDKGLIMCFHLNEAFRKNLLLVAFIFLFCGKCTTYLLADMKNQAVLIVSVLWYSVFLLWQPFSSNWYFLTWRELDRIGRDSKTACSMGFPV